MGGKATRSTNCKLASAPVLVVLMRPRVKIFRSWIQKSPVLRVLLHMPCRLVIRFLGYSEIGPKTAKAQIQLQVRALGCRHIYSPSACVPVVGHRNKWHISYSLRSLRATAALLKSDTLAPLGAGAAAMEQHRFLDKDLTGLGGRMQAYGQQVILAFSSVPLSWSADPFSIAWAGNPGK